MRFFLSLPKRLAAILVLPLFCLSLLYPNLAIADVNEVEAVLSATPLNGLTLRVPHDLTHGRSLKFSVSIDPAHPGYAAIPEYGTLISEKINYHCYGRYDSASNSIVINVIDDGNSFYIDGRGYNYYEPEEGE